MVVQSVHVVISHGVDVYALSHDRLVSVSVEGVSGGETTGDASYESVGDVVSPER